MRVIAGPEKKTRVMSEKERLITAYHEMGHAIVGHFLEHSDPVHKISIISRGQALGYTISMPQEDKFLTTKAELTDNLAMTLGGRAAEEIVFSEITTGASNDLEKVTATAKQMVMRFGMSEKLGPRVFGHDHGQPFLGREFSAEPDYSDEIAREIDDEIRRIVEAAHQRAKDLLTEHRDELGTISEILVKRETIEKEEFEGLLAGKTEEEVFGSEAPPPGSPIPGEPALVAALEEDDLAMNPRPASERAVGVAPLIVGVDGSERSRDALALAVQLAEPGQGVLLAHVHPYGALSDLLSGDDYARLVREVAESTLSAANETLPPATERVMQLVSNRSPAAGLHDLAAEKDAALIVVGSSHRSGLGRVLAGSVAESVLAGSPVPVAIAPRGLAGSEDSIRIVGCGFDGSPEADAALGWAADIARRRRARLEVLAVHPRIAFAGVSSAGAFGYQSADDTLRRTLEKQMRDAIASLGPGVDISGRLLDGDPSTALVDASKELDLLTLGSRGYGPIRAVLLGSVSRTLVREGACSVVVLPRGAGTNRGDAAQ